MFELLLPLFAGLVVGVLIGLTGMGGGALMTPFLIIFMKLELVLAVGTDLAFAAITKVAGGIKHRREKNVALRKVAWIAFGSIPASIISAQFILLHTQDHNLVENTLPKLLGFILMLVSLVIFARVFRLLGPKEQVEIIWPSPLALITIGAIGGGALVGDLPPTSRTSLNLVKSAKSGESRHEKTFYRRADRRDFERRRSRCAGQRDLQEAQCFRCHILYLA